MRFIVCCMSEAIYAECNGIKMGMHDHENTRDSLATIPCPPGGNLEAIEKWAPPWFPPGETENHA